MAVKEYDKAIVNFTQAVSLKDDVKEAYKFRSECFRELAKKARGKKKSEYTTLAEADEKKYEELKNHSND